MKKGMFITLEGPDGSGKSTIALMLIEALKKDGYDVVHTREPGGIDISEQIRRVILDPKNNKMDQKTEALLYAASRRQHLVEKVIPAINDGKVVICERFVDSSLAYQGYAREIGIEEVYKINEFAIEDYFPDLTIYLDVDESLGLSRIKDRQFKDRLDQESLDFHSKVNEGYQIVNKRFEKRITIVDARMCIQDVFDSCFKIIKDKLNER